MAHRLASCLLLLLAAGSAASAALDNVTGLPAYPNLSSAAMDPNYRVEALGRWCARFSSTSSDSLNTVTVWYRKNLKAASETDLDNDEQFRGIANPGGVKLAVGLNYVALYRASNQLTVIELHRCAWN
jgi:hypothetical protein